MERLGDIVGCCHSSENRCVHCVECHPQMSDSVVYLINGLTVSCDSCEVDSVVDAKSLIDHLVEDVVTILQTNHAHRNFACALCEVRHCPTAIITAVCRVKCPYSSRNIHFPLNTLFGALVEHLRISASLTHHSCEGCAYKPCRKRVLVLQGIAKRIVFETRTIRDNVDKVSSEFFNIDYSSALFEHHSCSFHSY